MALRSVFPLSQFVSWNQEFVGTKAINFWQRDKLSFQNVDEFFEIRRLVYFSTGLVRI